MRRPKLVFLVNGGPASAMGIRARSFAERLTNEFQIDIAYRSSNKIYAILEFFRLLFRARPSLVYVFDMSFSGVLAAGLYRLVSRSRLMVDTGDAIYELSRSTGNRGLLALSLTWGLEWFGFWVSDRVVVRSHPHQDLLAARGIAAEVLPDGVDTTQFSPRPDEDLRRKYNLEGSTVIGVLGSLTWSPRLQSCYGWDLIELIHLLQDRPVKGLIVGDGSGLARLKAQCVEHGIEDRVVFAGRIPYDQLPGFISLMDVALSTQTNDIPGQVRTTGKLPIYLACGRYVLASQVGEAARVLPSEMLVPYNGTQDADYPQRLAACVRSLLQRPQKLEQAAARAVALAKTHFEYDVLATRLRDAIHDLLPGAGTAAPPVREKEEQAHPCNLKP